MRYAGQAPSAIWEDWVLTTLSDFQAIGDTNADVAYHEYFVCTWMAATTKNAGDSQAVLTGRTRFERRDVSPGPLRSMSNYLLRLEDARSADWTQMRPLLEQCVDEDGYEILTSAQHSTTEFEAFFKQFSRIKIAV